MNWTSQMSGLLRRQVLLPNEEWIHTTHAKATYFYSFNFHSLTFDSPRIYFNDFIFSRWLASYHNTICGVFHLFPADFKCILCYTANCAYLTLFGVPVLFYWFVCPFLCEYATALITLALEYTSIADRTSLFVFLFFPEISC